MEHEWCAQAIACLFVCGALTNKYMCVCVCARPRARIAAVDVVYSTAPQNAKRGFCARCSTLMSFLARCVCVRGVVKSLLLWWRNLRQNILLYVYIYGFCVRCAGCNGANQFEVVFRNKILKCVINLLWKIFVFVFAINKEYIIFKGFMHNSQKKTSIVFVLTNLIFLCALPHAAFKEINHNNKKTPT